VEVDVRCCAAGVRIADDRHGGDRGAHALLVGFGDRGAEDVAVGGADRFDHFLGGGGVVVEQLADAGDDDLAGDLAGLVSAHAVGDHEDAVGDEEVVLVLGAHHPRVGGRAGSDLRHQ
jgi:hypothetical protein